MISFLLEYSGGRGVGEKDERIEERTGPQTKEEKNREEVKSRSKKVEANK